VLLAIDTATRVISLALHDGSHLLAEQTWHSANNHSTELAPAVAALLKRCDQTVADLTVLGVSIGPGSYTGLRIGVALAKGIASARKLPLVGVSTLDTLAAGQTYYSSNHGLIAVVQAGRGRVIVKTYRWRKGHWTSHSEPQLMDWETLFARVDGPAYLTGEVDAAGQEALKAAREKHIQVDLAAPVFRLRRAGFLAEEAWSRLKNSKDEFPASKVIPIYVKTTDLP
jgi:tRNA threonylcarbamoyladenosine biosynthesis protein TsaB